MLDTLLKLELLSCRLDVVITQGLPLGRWLTVWFSCCLVSNTQHLPAFHWNYLYYVCTCTSELLWVLFVYRNNVIAYIVSIMTPSHSSFLQCASCPYHKLCTDYKPCRPKCLFDESLCVYSCILFLPWIRAGKCQPRTRLLVTWSQIIGC